MTISTVAEPESVRQTSAATTEQAGTGGETSRDVPFAETVRRAISAAVRHAPADAMRSGRERLVEHLHEALESRVHEALIDHPEYSDSIAGYDSEIRRCAAEIADVMAEAAADMVWGRWREPFLNDGRPHLVPDVHSADRSA